MALTIETGAGVSGANSYASLAELRAFASVRGITLPQVESACESMLVGAADYLNTKTWIGTPSTAEQYLAWPRRGALLYGVSQEGLIPTQVKNAQLLLTLEINASGELLPNTRPNDTKRVKIDALSIEYFKMEEAANAITTPVVDALLKPLLGVNAGTFITVRA